MAESYEDRSWTMLHHLAMVYLALAHGTDQKLHDDELTTMVEKLQEWAPDLPKTTVQEIVMEASAVYLEPAFNDEVARAMLMIRKALPRLERFAVLDDLIKIAEADGIVLDSEEGLIRALAKIWNLQTPKPAQNGQA